jgi:hypothetical protein
VAFWTGGLWKTTNKGTVRQPGATGDRRRHGGAVGREYHCGSIPGDAFVAQFMRGDGVYKSTDAGRTWASMGLRDTHHISRIMIDPANQTLSTSRHGTSLFRQSRPRGLQDLRWRQTWQSLYINERIGVIDLVMDPQNPSAVPPPMTRSGCPGRS